MATVNYYKLLKDTLLKYDYFRFDSKGNQVSDATMIDNFCRYVIKSSCDEPKLDPSENVPTPVAESIKNDETLIMIIDTIKRKKTEFTDYHVKKASAMFTEFKDLIDELKKDPANQELRESYNEITQQSGILSKLVNPDNMMMAIIAAYKSKFIGVSDKERTTVLADFKNAGLVFMKVMQCLLDKTDRKAIITEHDLRETGPDRFDTEACVTEKDFEKSSLITDYFTKMKSLSDIFRKISPCHRETLSRYIREIYCHFICAVFSMRYAIFFTGASKGSKQVFSFGTFLGNIQYHSELLKPFDFPLQEAVIFM